MTLHLPRKAVFFDFHTMPGYPAVGTELDCDAVARELRHCGVDYIVFPARCNLGMAYFNTQYGIRHPGLSFDLVGQMLEACHREGIAFGAYLNIGLSHEEGLRHREWCTISTEGRVYEPPLLDHAFRKMCYNSGYAEHLLAMIGELLDNYPLDGMFFDCFTPHPCIGVECQREMRERGMEANAFARFSRNRLLRRIGERIHASGRELLLYFNCVQYADQQEFATYFEVECLPNGGWGYDFLPLYARYIRHLGKPAVNMAARFHESWGDFGGLRPRASLLFDVVTGLANTLATDIADHFHPSGRLNLPVFELIRSVYDEITPLEAWTLEATAVTDMALMVPEDTMDNTLEAVPSIFAAQGLTRMLTELKCQFEVILPGESFGAAKLLIVGDDIRFDPALTAQIREFLARGGKVIASGHAGTGGDNEDFALPEIWGAHCRGTSPYNPGYFQLAEEDFAPLPAMPIVIHQPGIVLDAGTAATKAVTVVPFANRHFDGEHAWLYLPPEQPDGHAFLTLTEQVAHFAAPLGTNYYHHAQPALRQLLEAALRQLLPEPLLQSTGLPTFGRATVTRQPGRRMIWLTAFIPEKRGAKLEMVEEPIELARVIVKLRQENTAPRRVYTVPTETPVDFTLQAGYIQIAVPPFAGYCVIAVEE